MKKILNKISKLGKPYYILPIITLLFLTGFIGSYLFPNTVLDTYVINMTETEGDEEVLLPLSATDPVTYEMNTGTLAMRGIQVGINKQGQALSGTTLVYCVYAEGNCVSENRYAVGTGDDLQYVYLPFENQKDCVGKLKITFRLENEGETDSVLPALMANHTEVKDTVTTPAQAESELKQPATQTENVSLKCSYIYTHNTYPFLYDCRLLTFVFLAASMAVCYPGKKKEEQV